MFDHTAIARQWRCKRQYGIGSDYGHFGQFYQRLETEYTTAVACLERRKPWGWIMSTDVIFRYKTLIEKFLSGSIDANTFEYSYLDMFKKERVILPEPVFEILDRLFADVDAFCSDPALRTDSDLNEQQLREMCLNALHKLE